MYNDGSGSSDEERERINQAIRKENLERQLPGGKYTCIVEYYTLPPSLDNWFMFGFGVIFWLRPIEAGHEVDQIELLRVGGLEGKTIHGGKLGGEKLVKFLDDCGVGAGAIEDRLKWSIGRQVGVIAERNRYAMTILKESYPAPGAEQTGIK